ncbi:MAG: HAD family phosphatase [Clostridiales bacterium]
MKAAIFDLDGTLLDSMGMWRNVLPNYLKSLNITNGKEINELVEKLSFVQAATYVSEKFDLGKTADEIYNEIEESIVYQYKNVIERKPYVLEYLEGLKNSGVHMCLATLTDGYMAELVTERLGIREYLDFILTVGEVGVGKHKPTIYLTCAEKFGFAVADCVVFEDAPYAIETAKKAGFQCYGICDKWQSYPKGFTDKYCDKFITNFEELLKEV